ncbi:hypothetical protein [Rhizobacter sp. Root1221]|uniref:hypothetical protein n=1 Tax=Rhizobacter sp. Root1221 TaxID=1736433 RepID=UPI0012FC2CB2|nr:hypothetical protein [Rhizobacter sp. Root1221]
MSKTLTDTQHHWLKWRQVVEPSIGHAKHDNDGMQRCAACRVVRTEPATSKFAGAAVFPDRGLRVG